MYDYCTSDVTYLIRFDITLSNPAIDDSNQHLSVSVDFNRAD